MLQLPELDAVEQRVLGCLVEKELATPEYYPLSLNALVNACNQKSSREPVMTLGEDTVTLALERLRHLGLARLAAGGGRVDKFSHSLEAKLSLHPAELAIMALLLLRGAQTLGELRSRSNRLYAFADLNAVETVIQELDERDPPLVAALERQPGRKEIRFGHCLGPLPEPEQGQVAIELTGGNAFDRLEEVELEVARLRDELTALRAEFTGFRQQFD